MPPTAMQGTTAAPLVTSAERSAPPSAPFQACHATRASQRASALSTRPRWSTTGSSGTMVPTMAVSTQAFADTTVNAPLTPPPPPSLPSCRRTLLAVQARVWTSIPPQRPCAWQRMGVALSPSPLWRRPAWTCSLPQARRAWRSSSQQAAHRQVRATRACGRCRDHLITTLSPPSPRPCACPCGTRELTRRRLPDLLPVPPHHHQLHLQQRVQEQGGLGHRCVSVTVWRANPPRRHPHHIGAR